MVNVETRNHPDRPRSEGGAWGSYIPYLDQVETERDWLLAEAPDELRNRFFAIRAREAAHDLDGTDPPPDASFPQRPEQPAPVTEGTPNPQDGSEAAEPKETS